VYAIINLYDGCIIKEFNVLDLLFLFCLPGMIADRLQLSSVT
jgi:hypothetical protein